MNASDEGRSSRKWGRAGPRGRRILAAYGFMLVPPWMISSRLGKKLGRDFPPSSAQRLRSRSIQGGTPEMARIFGSSRRSRAR